MSACICANNEDLFDSLEPIPDAGLWTDDEKSNNNHYLEQLDHKAVELGIDRDTVYAGYMSEEEPKPLHTTWPDIQDVPPSDVGSVLLHACVADESIRPVIPFHALDLGDVYHYKPFVEPEENRKLVVGLRRNPKAPRGGYFGVKRRREYPRVRFATLS